MISSRKVLFELIENHLEESSKMTCLNFDRSREKSFVGRVASALKICLLYLKTILIMFFLMFIFLDLKFFIFNKVKK